jgi:hypothetical protein
LCTRRADASGRQEPGSGAVDARRTGRTRHRDLAYVIVVPPGYRLALNMRRNDEVDGCDIALPSAPYPMKGVGSFLHIDHDEPAR